MEFLKKIFTLIGVIAVILVLFTFAKFGTKISQFNQLDPKAMSTYMDMFDKVLATGDPAKGMVIKRKLVIEDGTTKEEAIENAIETMDDVASEHGLAMVDSKTMPRGGKFMKDGGLYTHIRSYCSPTIADIFLNYSGEFIGFMPCRVGIVEDKKGDIWLYTMSLDLMIHGGKPLPKKLLSYANEVRDAMVEMITKGASGDI